MLKTNGFFVMSEEDSFENGCNPDSSRISEDNTHFTATNEQDLIDQIKDYLQVEDNAIILNSCEEKGRIDIQRLEDSAGNNATKNQISRWKLGKLKLYAVMYSARVEEVVEFEFSKHATIETN